MIIAKTISAFAIITIVSAQSSINLETKTPLITKEGGKVLKRCTDNVASSLVVRLVVGDYYNSNSGKTLENLDQVYHDHLYEFSLVTKEPNCMSGTFNVTLFLTNNGTSLRGKDEQEYLDFTSEGAAAYWVQNSIRTKSIVFHRENYCISSITEELISLKLCKSQCYARDEEEGDNLCVSRCCPPGKISSISGDTLQGCIPVNGRDWYPEIFVGENSTAPEKSQVYPQILVNDEQFRKAWNCSKDSEKFGTRVIKSRIRILPEGRILFHQTSQLPSKWVDFLSKEEYLSYCMDGLRDPLRPADDNYFLVFQTCLTQIEIHQEELRVKKTHHMLFLIRLLFFLVHLPCTLTYLVMFLIYLSIWDKHHVHGWIVLGFSLSQFLYFLFHAIIYFLVGFSKNLISIFTPLNPTCYLFGVFINFFLISQHSWTVVITFDLWKTLSSLKPESSQSKGKLLARYISFAIGIPTFVAFFVAVPMEFLAKGQNVIIPGYREKCIGFGMSDLLYIVIPSLILFIANLVFAGLTFKTLRVAQNNAKKMTSTRKKDTTESQAVLMAKLLFVMGFSLIMDFIRYILGIYFLYSDFIMGFNFLQAIGLFWTFVCGKKTQEHLREKFPSLFRIFKRNSKPKAMVSESDRSREFPLTDVNKISD